MYFVESGATIMLERAGASDFWMHTPPMSRNNTALVAALLLAAFAAAPALAAEGSSAPSKVDTATGKIGETLAAPAVTPGLAGSFLSGRFARHQQDLDEAARYLGATLARDPENRPLIHETMRMNLLAGNSRKAIELAHRLEDEAADDPLISTILMLEKLETEDWPAAKKLIAATPKTGLYGVVKPVVLRWLEIGAGEISQQVSLQKTINKSGFFAPFLTYHQALMNDVLGNEATARASYLQASEDAAVTPYRVVEALANFYMRHRQWSEAQQLFDAYQQANPDSTLLPEKITPNDEPVAPLVRNARDGLAELFFTTASILYGEETSQETFLYLRIALTLRPKLPPAQLMLANLYEQMEDYKHAIATYDAIPRGNVFYRRGQIRKALNLEAMDRKEEAIELLRTLAQSEPVDNNANITLGDILREEEKYEEAAGAYTDAIAHAEPLRESDWPLLYARGISFERAGEWTKAEEDFARALKLEPNQPDVLNYLAYSWLMRNEHVGQAREYLEIAASARPQEAHIIDSLGWAHYLSGDFHKAVAELERAVELMPDDATVNDHLGDAYWRIGRQMEAKFQWQRALNSKPGVAEGEIIRGKIENGLPPFMNQQSAANPALTPNEEEVTALPFAKQVP